MARHGITTRQEGLVRITDTSHTLIRSTLLRSRFRSRNSSCSSLKTFLSQGDRWFSFIRVETLSENRMSGAVMLFPRPLPLFIFMFILSKLLLLLLFRSLLRNIVIHQPE